MADSPLLLLLLRLLACIALPAFAHNDHAPPSQCHRDSQLHLQAAFRPGLITVDGISSDWTSVVGQSFVPLQAIQPDPNQPYPFGKLDIKVVHDGHDMFFLVEFPGPYEFTQGDNHKCPSVALMFGVGDDATYNNMGGCQETSDTCSSVSCNGHAVDIMHFTIGTAIPGRLYGANIFDNLNSTGRDSFGHLNDMYGWNPHCRYIDGLSPNGSSIAGSGAQNDWQGAWSHSTMDLSYGLISSDSPYSTSGNIGTYTYEFSRRLRTSDRLQQDVQFTIGGTHSFIAAFWYPVSHVAWKGYQHYSASCDWIPLEILPATTYSATSSENKMPSILSVFTLLLSVVALITSIVTFWRARSKTQGQFQIIDNL